MAHAAHIAILSARARVVAWSPFMGCQRRIFHVAGHVAMQVETSAALFTTLARLRVHTRFPVSSLTAFTFVVDHGAPGKMVVPAGLEPATWPL